MFIVLTHNTCTCPITVVPLHVATADHGDFVYHDDKPTLLVFHLLANVVTEINPRLQIP